MAKSIGSIEIILGNGTLIDVKGQEKKLVNNLKLFEDDVLATGDNTTLLVKLANGKTISLGANRVLTLDDSVLKEEAYSDDETQAKIEKIQEILAEATEQDNLDETASGDDVAISSSSIGAMSTSTHNQHTQYTESSMLEASQSQRSPAATDADDIFIVPAGARNVILGIDNIITNDTTPTIRGTTNDSTVDIVINVGGTDYTANNNGDGTWSLTVDKPLSEGDNIITVIATDPGGNTTEVTATVTVDTTLNDANNSNGGNVVTIDSITEDTGNDDSDFITSDKTLVINGTFDNEVDHSLNVTINGTDYTPTIDGNLWSVNLDATDDGSYRVLAVVSDTAGNMVNSSKTILVDTTLAGANGSNETDSITIDSITEDTGISNTDFITSDTTLTVTGTYDNSDGNSLEITIGDNTYTTDNGITVNDNQWSIDLPELTDGENNLEITISDAAGNTETITQTITVDTTLNDSNNSNSGNSVTIDTITEDTGDNASDFITADNTLVVSGTFDNEDDHTLSIVINGTEYTPSIEGNLWTVDLTSTTLNDGLYNVVATLTDTAGNIVTTSEAVLVDTNTGTGSTDNGNGNAADGSDVTISLNSVTDDNIINAQEAQNEDVVISGTTSAQDGAEISLSVGSVSLATVLANNGTFAYSVPAGSFALFSDGTYTLLAEVVADKAGNIASDSQEVLLDTTLNGGSGSNNSENITIDSITEDTGVSDSDFITSDTTLTVTGTYNNTDGNSLEISVGGNTYTTDNGITLNDNQWSINLPELSDGENNLEITISDAAGNKETITQTITVDTAADTDDGTGTGNTVAATITLDTISGDNFLNENEAGNILTLAGTSNVIGATVAITINGNPFTSAIVNTDGSYSVDVDTTVIKTFPDGEYEVVATVVTDDAGNSINATQTVVLDTTLDADSDNPIVDDNGDSVNVTIDSITEDTGIKDFITTDNEIRISGRVNAESGNTLIVKVDSTVYSTDDVNSLLSINGTNWTLNLESTTLAEGQYSVTAIVKDAAGNGETAQQNIQIVDSTDIGTINLDEISDNYINAQEATEILSITGTSSEIGQTVSFKLNNNPLVIGGSTVTATVASDGTFSIDIPADTFSAYVDGEYFVEASVVKSADGITYTDTENVFLDRSSTGTGGGGTGTNGDDATISLATIGDSIINAQENLTGLRVTGTTTAVEGTAISFITSSGEVITTSSNGQAITASIDANGNSFYDVFIKIPNLVDGESITLTAQVVADKAGNLAQSNETYTLDVDLSAGTITTHNSTTAVYESALDIGSSPSNSERATSGNIFAGDDIGNSSLSSFSANEQEATIWSENSSILTLTTDSGTLFIAKEATTQDGITYNAGDYVYILENASSTTQDTFTYTLSDAAGNSVSADLNISIVDDSAMINEDGAINKYISADTSGYTTNLILTLDVSGSMTYDADGSKPGDGHYEGGLFGFIGAKWVSDYDESTIRIDLAKDALKNLIDKYAELGDVNVQVISFNNTATPSAMLSADAAKTYIDGLTADGGTDYQAALDAAQANPVDTYPDANTTQYYFISDGQPNDNITSSEYTQWQTYIKESPIDKTYAIGVGSQVDTTQLNNVSGEMTAGPDIPNETSGIDGDTILINSITDLDDTLIQTVNTTVVTGSLTSFDADGTAIDLGADGGHITQIDVYNQAGDIINTLSYDAQNLAQSSTTELGGTLNINFTDGEYSYNIDLQNNITAQIERFDVTVEGADGESVTNTINIHLEDSVNENFAFDGSAVDGALGYDTLVLSGTQILDFDTISNIKNIEEIDMSKGDNQVLNIDINDVIGITDSSNELFISGESGDNVTLDPTLIKQNTTTTDSNGNVFDVYSDSDTTVTVNIEQEIVVS